MFKTNSPFRIKEINNDSLQGPWRCHQEYEIGLILSGQFEISLNEESDVNLQEGNIFMIGPDTPHRLSPILASKQNSFISILFEEFGLGKGLFDLPEMTKVKNLLNESLAGLKYESSSVLGVQPYFQKLMETTGASKIILFLQLLNGIALNKDWEYLFKKSSLIYRSQLNSSMSRILSYISNNFDQTITLDEVARMTNLSRYAFCRYFKLFTNKSFVNYLNEFRIKMACKMLHSKQYNISQICFTSGFNTLSNFNKQFKRIMKCTPTKYRELYLKSFK